MKKIKYLFLLILTCFLLSGCNSNDYLKDISYSKLQSKLENKDTFFFIVVRDGCSFCESLITRVEDVLEENEVVGYKLNLSNMSSDDLEDFANKYNVDGTPTTIFITEGTEVSIMQRIEGSVSKEYFKEKLQQNNYIK